MLSFMIMCVVSMGFTLNAADASNDKISKGLIELVYHNDIRGKKEDLNGKNLNDIKKYIEQNRSEINFDATHKVAGISGLFTALELACYIKACSPLVVSLLCEHGADPVKKQGTFSPATCCIQNIFDCENSGETGLTPHQRQKLFVLKCYRKSYTPLEVDMEALTIDIKDILLTKGEQKLFDGTTQEIKKY